DSLEHHDVLGRRSRWAREIDLRHAAGRELREQLIAAEISSVARDQCPRRNRHPLIMPEEFPGFKPELTWVVSIADPASGGCKPWSRAATSRILLRSLSRSVRRALRYPPTPRLRSDVALHGGLIWDRPLAQIGTVMKWS